MMESGAMVRLCAAFRLRVLLSGLSPLRGSQASKNFNTENAENHELPRRKARMAHRAKRFTPVLQQAGVAVCPARRPVSFLRRSPRFSASSVLNSFFLAFLAHVEPRT
jgi:hypothetical protein